MKGFAFVEEPYEEKVGRDPVQVGRRTIEALRKINVFGPGAHVPIVSPLARDLILHGFPETLKNLRKNKGLEHAGRKD